MKYKEYQEAFVRCPECNSYVDMDSMLCKKCGYDASKEIKNGRATNPKTKQFAKKHY
jgi:hypothetical protein